MIIIPFLVYTVLSIYEFVPLYKQKLWRDFWVNLCLAFVSFVFAVMITLGVDIPSPAVPLQNMILSMLGK